MFKPHEPGLHACLHFACLSVPGWTSQPAPWPTHNVKLPSPALAPLDGLRSGSSATNAPLCPELQAVSSHGSCQGLELTKCSRREAY